MKYSLNIITEISIDKSIWRSSFLFIFQNSSVKKKKDHYFYNHIYRFLIHHNIKVKIKLMYSDPN